MLENQFHQTNIAMQKERTLLTLNESGEYDLSEIVVPFVLFVDIENNTQLWKPA